MTLQIFNKRTQIINKNASAKKRLAGLNKNCEFLTDLH